jgi:hypothetical protein
MDCASDTWAMHRQGDGRVSIHDWGMEFTAAGGLLQAELLLVGRDPAALAKYLPKLERCASFIESRRDPTNNLFLAGPAGNLLAPSYAGCKMPDGTYGKAYLAGLSVTSIAFLDRLIELEKLAKRADQVQLWSSRRALARQGLALVTTDEGYFVKSIDPDGARHGVYGAALHGYFEASPNHDAICFRVADDAQSKRIYQKLASIPGLRPHDLIVANCPSLDDMYEAPQGLWGFGTWVNGGHWTTCEARALMAYYRLGKYEDARRSMKQIMTFARQFRMDNPLVDFGNAVYQPAEPVNLTYDAFGAPAGLIRGLFEYLYSAEGLRLAPHIPDGITQLEQRFPIRFGSKRLYLAVAGHGPITSVRVNGKRWKLFDAESVFLPYQSTPEVAAIQINRAAAAAKAFTAPESSWSIAPLPSSAAWHLPEDGELMASTRRTTSEMALKTLLERAARLRRFHQAVVAAGLKDTYEAAHARLAINCLRAAFERGELLSTGKLTALPARSEAAADKLYLSTPMKLCDGLEKLLNAWQGSSDPRKRQVYELWRAASRS